MKKKSPADAPRPLYSGPSFSVLEEDVTLPDGRIRRYAWVDHRPVICVVPLDAAGRIIMIRQYRHAIRDTLLEIPAGTMDRGAESIEDCVQREMAEEIGMKAGRLRKLFEGYLVPGYGNEYMYFFLATELFAAPLPKDDDEFIEPYPVAPADAQRLIREGKIRDCKTALGIQLALAVLPACGVSP